MFSEAKVTEIYCMTDDFYKEFALQQEKFMVKDKSCKHCNKPDCMSVEFSPVWYLTFVL